MAKKRYCIGKVTLDASQDRSCDQYSDGSIEDELLAAARAGRWDEMLHEDERWPVLYHFSEERQNILSWLPLTKEDAVLEIGCGCGAVTGTLCRKAGRVDAVEISPRRAEIAAYRNQSCGNLTIYVGNLNDLALGRKYDVVTLIGVLEYAGTFTHTAQPYHDFLAQCRSFLKPGGRLVIAIENRLGMKYWSGAHEDHTGRRFDGILDYPRGGRHPYILAQRTRAAARRCRPLRAVVVLSVPRLQVPVRAPLRPHAAASGRDPRLRECDVRRGSL
ncbi:bifunctional 2-polyprenyl-6-hydroxyphenol methylase/3-demethylubiquinol 3-O-methyltransferase UbiG [Selenomonas sp.]|uniref:class I SAM-dependent methyltransferase n=1 Tax=Selenomonas sp. TaxID=2053611 RepID=UPI0025F52D18|nr:class I SAM-dependent methyltransferase [Selenomonas sp.]MCI6284320.1 class I SAM-dependent methyltransferase [Selenomonas sp.]